MTSENIRNVTFEHVRKGYRPEDVDDFLMQIAHMVDQLEQERDRAVQDRDNLAQEYDTLLASKEDMERKLYVLASKVEEYRGQEDTLKTALINAQRMGETVVHEAKQKAEQILRDATGQGELLRQSAEQEIVREREVLEGLVREVGHFKTEILSLYKQHIESLSALEPPMQRAEEALHGSGETADKVVETVQENENVKTLQEEPTDNALTEAESMEPVKTVPMPLVGMAEPELPDLTQSMEKDENPRVSLFEGSLLEE